MFLLILLKISFFALSQRPPIKIRQSFESADAKAEPAVISYTNPKKGDASYLIDAAFGLSLLANSRQTANILIELHRNTLVDEESDNRQVGIAYELFTNANWLSPGNPATTLINVNGKYSHNKIKGIQSAQLAGEITRIYAKGMATGFFPNMWHQLGNQLAMEYFPAIGVEFEERFKTEDAIDKGEIFRGIVKLNISVYPFSLMFKNKIELFGNLTHKQDVINGTGRDDMTHPSIETGAKFNIVNNAKAKVSLGISYNNLDNPALGKEKQNFWIIALKAKI